VHRSLLSEVDLEITLPMITDRTREIASAAAVAVVTLAEDGTRDVMAASGEAAATVLAQLEEPLAQALSTGQAVGLVDTASTVSLGQDQGRTRTSLLPATPRSQQPAVLVVAGWRPRPGLGEARVSE